MKYQCRFLFQDMILPNEHFDMELSSKKHKPLPLGALSNAVFPFAMKRHIPGLAR